MDNIIKIKIKAFTDDIILPEKITVGDWIDLRASDTILLNKGDFKMIFRRQRPMVFYGDGDT